MGLDSAAELFDQFVSRTAYLMDEEFGQDPAVALDVPPARNKLRGLVDYKDGQPVWWSFEVSADQLTNTGPDALAYEFIRGLRIARQEFERFK